MSVKIMTLVWEHAPCRENALIVLLALADWSNDEGLCWPSMQKLADKTRIDRRSAQRIVRRLKDDGLIRIEEGGGRAKQHKYTIETAALCRPLENSDIQNSDIAYTERATLETERATFPTQTATPVSPDPLEEPLEEPSREPSAHASLMAYHSKRIGKIPDGAAQAGAVKWILDAGFTVEQSEACYDFQLTEDWRNGNVSWLTVKSKIGAWVSTQPKVKPKIDRAAWEAEQRRKHGWPEFDERRTA